MSKLLRGVIPGIALLSMILIIVACAAPPSTNISNELPVQNQAIKSSQQATLTSMSQPVTCQVAGLAISPIKVNPGEKTTITAYVINTGDKDVSYIAELEVNKAVAQVIEVDIPAERTQSVTFTVAKDEPGTYEINCGGLTGKLVVINTVVPPKSNTSLLNPPQSNVPSCCATPGSAQSSTPSYSIDSEVSAFPQQSSTPSCCAQ